MTWQNLYLYSGERIRQSTIKPILEAELIESGWELYDPFGIIPGKAFPQQIRLFIAPESAGWVRILGDVSEQFLPALSRYGFAMLCILDENQPDVLTWHDGAAVDPAETLTAHLQQGCSPETLHRALDELKKPVTVRRFDDNVVPLDALPEDIQEMAQGLGKWRTKLLFNQMMKRVNKQFSGDADAARELLKSQEPDWKGVGGRRLATLMDCLTIPDHWHKPDLVTLRDAYQLHLRRQRLPNASLLPGDQAIIEAVPDALDYEPVYGGKSETTS